MAPLSREPGPIEPVDPVDPVEPVDPVDPVEPVDPVAPGTRPGIDPDVDHADAARRAELAQHPLALLAAVALGGVVGSEARYALTVAFPDGDGVPWTTFAVNVLGCLAIGVLMAGVRRRWGVRRPLLRPFAGVGVLGGFTTFSAYAVGVERLLDAGRLAPALAYVVLTPVAAVAAAAAGLTLGRRVL
ncbi:MAG TPA: CrcB family protein [Kineosporiaceae bacterium]|nr:CrcB family protein [Kineosporiaceae bacterium]